MGKNCPMIYQKLPLDHFIAIKWVQDHQLSQNSSKSIRNNRYGEFGSILVVLDVLWVAQKG